MIIIESLYKNEKHYFDECDAEGAYLWLKEYEAYGKDTVICLQYILENIEVDDCYGGYH